MSLPKFGEVFTRVGGLSIHHANLSKKIALPSTRRPRRPWGALPARASRRTKPIGVDQRSHLHAILVPVSLRTHDLAAKQNQAAGLLGSDHEVHLTVQEIVIVAASMTSGTAMGTRMPNFGEVFTPIN